MEVRGSSAKLTGPWGPGRRVRTVAVWAVWRCQWARGMTKRWPAGTVRSMRSASWVPTTDVYDSHDYTQDVEEFRARHAGLRDGEPFVNRSATVVWSIPYRGQPFFVSEFGGIWWNPDAREGEDS